MPRTLCLLCGIVVLVLPVCVSATVYQCKGKDGRLIFTDRPCPPETSAQRIEIDHATRVEPREAPEVPVDQPLPSEPVAPPPESVVPVAPQDGEAEFQPAAEERETAVEKDVSETRREE